MRFYCSSLVFSNTKNGNSRKVARSQTVSFETIQTPNNSLRFAALHSGNITPTHNSKLVLWNRERLSRHSSYEEECWRFFLTFFFLHLNIINYTGTQKKVVCSFDQTHLPICTWGPFCPYTPKIWIKLQKVAKNCSYGDEQNFVDLDRVWFACSSILEIHKDRFLPSL